MRRSQLTLALLGLGSALLLSACTNPQVGSTCPVPTTGDSKSKQKEFGKCISQLGESVVDARLRKDVDILFLVDNSPSMTPKQKALANNIPKFIQKIDATGANYHVGIATSDIGSNVQPGVPWGGNIGKCDSYEGDDGVLQAVPCTTRNTVTPDARNGCAQLCPDDKFVPTDGRRFISKVDGVTNVPVSMERDPVTGKMVDTGPIKSFKCMALVGDDGCGIEGPLEGAKRAVDGHRSENSGFLRANSVLAVIFITDEDDCSVQMAKRDQNNPSYRDCDPTQPDSPECYNVDFRCLARSIQCNETLLTTGVKNACKERPNNYLEPVEKYYRFFSNLRPANKLLISGIWTLPSIDLGGKVEIARAGGTTTPNLNRAGGAGYRRCAGLMSSPPDRWSPAIRVRPTRSKSRSATSTTTRRHLTASPRPLSSDSRRSACRSFRRPMPMATRCVSSVMSMKPRPPAHQTPTPRSRSARRLAATLGQRRARPPRATTRSRWPARLKRVTATARSRARTRSSAATRW